MIMEPEFVTSMAKMAFFLILLVAGLWAFSRFAGKKLAGAGGGFGGKRIKVIENCHIGVKKTISLVKVPGKVLILGISGEHMTLLGEVDENTMPEILNDPIKDPAQSRFSGQFQRLTKTAQKNKSLIET